MCDTAHGTYDAEQTNRVSSCLWGAGYPPNAPSLAQWRQRTSCALPRIWGRLHGVCWAAYVKTSRSCHTASRAWERGTENGCKLRTVLGLQLVTRVLGDGTFHAHRLVSGVAYTEFASRACNEGNARTSNLD